MSHEHSRHWQYEDGCQICDTIASLHAFAYDTACYPPWVSEEEKEGLAVQDIHLILAAHRESKTVCGDCPGCGGSGNVTEPPCVCPDCLGAGWRPDRGPNNG